MWKIIIKIVWMINNKISTSFGHFLYYNYCIEKCDSCHSSGMLLGFGNDIDTCPCCDGFGYNDKGIKNGK